MSRSAWFPGARDLQRLQQRGAEVARKEAVNVERHRIIGHLEDIGHGSEYLKRKKKQKKIAIHDSV